MAVASSGPNHFSTGTFQIPYSGEWKLDVRTFTGVNDQIRFATTVVIR